MEIRMNVSHLTLYQMSMLNLFIVALLLLPLLHVHSWLVPPYFLFVENELCFLCLNFRESLIHLEQSRIWFLVI